MIKTAEDYCNKVCPKRWHGCNLCLKDGRDGRSTCQVYKAFQAGYEAAQFEDEEFNRLRKANKGKGV